MARSRANIARTNRQLGSKFELMVARLLDRWWLGTDDANLRADQLTFRRTPNSGAWAKTAIHKPGDIVGPDDFPFAVEVKRQASWSWDGFLHQGNGGIRPFWEQTVSQARTGEKFPLLLFTRQCTADLRKVYVVISAECFSILREAKAIGHPLVRKDGMCFYNAQTFFRGLAHDIEEALQ